MNSSDTMIGWITSTSPLTVSFTEGDDIRVTRRAAFLTGLKEGDTLLLLRIGVNRWMALAKIVAV